MKLSYFPFAKPFLMVMLFAMCLQLSPKKIFSQTPDNSSKSNKPKKDTKKPDKIVTKNTEKSPKTIIVIDAGHGGDDPGKPKGKATYKHEKDLNLAISLKLGKYITQNIPNVEVFYVRSGDRAVSLADRTDFANNKKADLFVSVHCNSNQNTKIDGAEVHVYGTPLEASVKLAELIKTEFSQKLKRKFRGVFDNKERGHNLYVLQYVDMPSVLIECGYMSNPKEEQFLNTEKGQNLIASGIYRAIKNYLAIPDIKEKEKSKTLYKVQILATDKPVSLENKRFEELGEKVEVIEIDNGKYRYKYLIGHEYTQERADELAQKVKKLGFKDAFVIQME